MVEIKKITKAEYRDDPYGGGPRLYIEFDDHTAYISYEQKLLRFGLVFLGPEFSEKFTAVVPASPEDGRPRPFKVEGFTNDLRILKMTQAYWQATNDDTWKPGPVPIPK